MVRTPRCTATNSRYKKAHRTGLEQATARWAPNERLGLNLEGRRWRRAGSSRRLGPKYGVAVNVWLPFAIGSAFVSTRVVTEVRIRRNRLHLQRRAVEFLAHAAARDGLGIDPPVQVRGRTARAQNDTDAGHPVAHAGHGND